MAITLESLNMIRLLPTIMFIASSFIVLFTTILKTNGIIFGYKDYDLIMSLPIKSGIVIASRLVTLYLMNITFVLLVMIPMAFVYIFQVHPSTGFYIYFFSSLLLIPVIPIAIATIIGSFIILISVKFRYTNLLNIILSLTFLVGFYIASSQLNNTKVDITSIYDSLSNIIYGIYPISKLYTETVCDFNFISFLLYVLITVAILAIYISILSKYYNKLNNALTSRSTRSNYRLGDLQENSVLKSLFMKEIKRYFSSPLYVVNTGIGSVFLILLSIALFLFNSKQLDQMLEIPGFSDMIKKIAPLISTALIATNCTTSSAISLEGNKLWILKSSPIDTTEIFLSKILVNVFVCFPAIVISTILFSIRLQLDFLYIISLFILPFVYSILIGILGLILNLHFPKMEWTTEAQVIKQSASAMLAPLCGMIIIALPIIAVIKVSVISPDIIILFTIIISMLLILCLFTYLKKYGQKIFYHI
jgi:ABC-2 type transport system permease protein